ncbi:MAG TPA: hypothetical protein VG734_16720 [Lacunisphaera sp.]|nr:hypothetical protein [Lacunisphaera sp.]
MIPVRPIVFAALASASVGLGVLAYNEHNGRLAAEELSQSLQAKLAKLAKAKAPAVQLAPTIPQATFPAGISAPAEPAEGPAAVTARADGPPAMAMRSPADLVGLLDSPEVQQLLNLRSRGALDGRYAALFKQLNLPPDQLQKFQQLLLDKQSTMRDVITAMRSQGLMPGPDSRDQIRTLVQNANAEIDSQIQATLGSAAYAQYQTYEQTQPQRNTVDRVQQRLSYSSQPLTDQQAASLVNIMAQEAQAAQAAGNGNGGGNRRGFAFGGGGGAPITDQTIQQASSILSPAQLTTLQELQVEQQAQAQLGRRARETFTGSRQRPPAPAATPAPATN